MHRIANEGDGHAKRQHGGHHDAKAQSQTELDVSKYHSSRCHAVAPQHAITLFKLVLRLVSGDDGRAGGQGRRKRGIFLVHFCLL